MRLSSSPVDHLSPSPSPSPSPPRSRRARRRRRAAPPPPSSQEPSSDYVDDDDDPHETGDDTELAADSSSSSFNSSPVITPPTYVNVVPLPVFRGVDPGECPVEHLARFDRACRANNAADPGVAARVFPASLDADAALWYDLAVAPLRPALPWPAVRSAFLLAFRPPDFAERARAQLMSLRQGEAESASRYHLRLQWILKRWPEHGIPDALLKGIFIDGLREGFQEWVVTQKPETLAEAVGLAMSWERAEGVREARRRLNKATAEDGGNRKCGFCGETGHEEGACEVRRRMRELWLRSKDDGSGGSCGGGGGGGGGGSVVRREGEEGGVVERVESLRRSRSTKSTCQCWKHQCWKKMERSNSAFGEGVDGCQGDG